MPRPRIVEWFRADPWPHLRRVLWTGPPILTLGALVVAVSFLTGVSSVVRVEAALGGLALVAGGALATVLGMRRVIGDEVLIAVRTDGLVLQGIGERGKRDRHQAGETLIPWDELESVRWDPTASGGGALRLARAERADGEREVVVIERSFAGIAGPELARRVASAKRKATMNLLR